MDQPVPIVEGLLGFLSLVVVVGATLAIIYHRHLRRARRAQRGVDPLSRSTMARRQPLPFSLPSRWLAVRTNNTALVSEIMGSSVATPHPWSDALSRSRERRLFLSAPVDGWTLVIGGALPDSAQDVDGLFHFLRRWSAALGEVHFYSSDRVLSFHAWVRMDSGRVTRAYAWAGETVWNEGRPTLEERELGLCCRDYGEEAAVVRYGETPAELQNMERVFLLARRWSIDPVAASEILLQQEGVESGDEGGSV